MAALLSVVESSKLSWNKKKSNCKGVDEHLWRSANLEIGSLLSWQRNLPKEKKKRVRLTANLNMAYIDKLFTFWGCLAICSILGPEVWSIKATKAHDIFTWSEARSLEVIPSSSLPCILLWEPKNKCKINRDKTLVEQEKWGLVLLVQNPQSIELALQGFSVLHLKISLHSQLQEEGKL